MLKRHVIIVFWLCHAICMMRPNSTPAKCIVESYNVRGEVVYHESVPVSNALILIFFDEKNVGCSGFTSETGQYEIKSCLFYTFKYSFLTDVCGDPSAITVIVYAEGYIPKRIQIKAENAKTAHDEKSFKVPSIVLTRMP